MGLDVYLFVCLNKTNGERGYGKPMKTFFLVLMMIVVSATQANAAWEPKKEWLTCKEDKDCDAVIVGCYQWQAVNKKFGSELLEDYWGKYGCADTFTAGLKPVQICQKSRCSNLPGSVVGETKPEEILKRKKANA